MDYVNDNEYVLLNVPSVLNANVNDFLSSLVSTALRDSFVVSVAVYSLSGMLFLVVLFLGGGCMFCLLPRRLIKERKQSLERLLKISQWRVERRIEHLTAELREKEIRRQQRLEKEEKEKKVRAELIERLKNKMEMRKKEKLELKKKEEEQQLKRKMDERLRSLSHSATMDAN
jgi:biopolymer transport protein ExbB/TolQ